MNTKNANLYSVWRAMHSRCENSHSKDYKRYGARGIRVCEEWEDYDQFYWWAIWSGYRDGLSIDRINNDGNYEPSNCRWVDVTEQSRNRRSNRHITYQGEKRCISEWAELTGIHKDTIRYRLKMGYTPEQIFNTPVHHEMGRKAVK